ncbi:MAG: class I SAM-dependent methyltransferase [Deltaproteobacteria bacterium]|nr:class I SAM-dependent methyltransferase [Deltaproteobacteria bacterium]
MAQDFYDQLWDQAWTAQQAVGPLTHNRYRLVLAELDGLESPGRVLDAGCGSGTLLSLLGARWPDAELHGIELSESAVAAASPALQERIVQGDLMNVARGHEAGSFDLIVCSEVLEHLEEPGEALDVLVGLLRIGGTAVLTVPGGMRHWTRQDDLAGHIQRFEYPAFELLARDAGLEVVSYYGWGGPLSATYYGLASRQDPDDLASSASSPLVSFVGKLLPRLFRLDDAFSGPGRPQLVLRGRRWR